MVTPITVIWLRWKKLKLANDKFKNKNKKKNYCDADKTIESNKSKTENIYTMKGVAKSVETPKQ